MADASSEAAALAHERFGVDAFASTAELFDRRRPEIVVIATPPRVRGEVVEEVAPAGVRAIVAEKPLALELEEAERQLDACDRNGVLLAVSHQSRYSAQFVRVKEVIDAGELGGIELLHGVCFGPLLDQGNHVVDALRWFAGSEVAWVMSQAEEDRARLEPLLPEGMQAWSDDEHPSPPFMTHQIGFESGLRATMETGLLYRRSQPFIDDWLQRRTLVLGTKGIAECRASGLLRITSVDREVEEPDAIERMGEATAALHANVRDAVLDGAPLRATGRDGLETLRVLLACLESASSGGLVELSGSRSTAATGSG